MTTSRATAPDPEVPAKVTRRRFSVEYRLRILKLADACKKPGDVSTQTGYRLATNTWLRKHCTSRTMPGIASLRRTKSAGRASPTCARTAAVVAVRAAAMAARVALTRTARAEVVVIVSRFSQAWGNPRPLIRMQDIQSDMVYGTWRRPLEGALTRMAQTSVNDTGGSAGHRGPRDRGAEIVAPGPSGSLLTYVSEHMRQCRRGCFTRSSTVQSLANGHHVDAVPDAERHTGRPVYPSAYA